MTRKIGRKCLWRTGRTRLTPREAKGQCCVEQPVTQEGGSREEGEEGTMGQVSTISTVVIQGREREADDEVDWAAIAREERMAKKVKKGEIS